jgi:hypothetical protein
MAVDLPQNPEFATPGPQIFPSQDDQDVYVSNNTSFMNNFKHSAKTETPTANIYNTVVSEKRKYITPGPSLTKEEIAGIEKEHPGLNLPDDANKNFADLLVDNWKEKKNFERIAAAAQPTWGGWLSSEAGALLGNLADPIGLAAAVFAPELAGIRRIETATSLADASLIRAQRGIAAGVGISIAQETGLKAADSAMDQNYDGIQGAINITTNGFLGGVLEPLGGLVTDKLFDGHLRYIKKGFQPVSSEDADQILETGANQVVNGKDVNVNVPLKQAMANQAKKIFDEIGGSKEDLNKLSEEVDNNHQRVLSDLAQNEEQLKIKGEEIQQKGETTERAKDFSDLMKKNGELSDQDRSHQIVKSYLDGEQKDISTSDFDEYVSQMQGNEGAFSHGGKTEPFEVEGETENISSLVDEKYPEDYQKSLRTKVPLDEEDRISLDEIEKDRGRVGKFRRLVRVATTCLSG